VARAALKVLVEENMIDNAAAMGAYFLEQLRQIQHPAVKEIRGIGLMIAVELHENTPGGARGICEALQEKGILCKETHTWTIRFAPPLVITKPDIDWAMEQIREVFAELEG
jgi:ornithine--oxo-acid transaminase